VRCFIHSDAEESPYESPVDLKGRPLKAKTKVTAKAETG
jgi:hypothetical protein